MGENNCCTEKDQLSDEEWKELEEECKKKCHIGKNENLRELIYNDAETLNEHGFTYDQFVNLLRKIIYHILSVPEKDCLKFTEEDIFTIKNNFPFNPYWSNWYKRKAKIFGGKFIAIYLVWGGAEECPFQSKEDDKYYGYQYGSNDVFLINENNEWFHFNDLLPHQIKNHHFFQGHGSSYRVDPLKCIQYFNMDNTKSYETDLVHEEIWSCTSFGSRVDDDLLVLQENDTYIIYDVNKKNECISGKPYLHIVTIKLPVEEILLYNKKLYCKYGTGTYYIDNVKINKVTSEKEKAENHFS